MREALREHNDIRKRHGASPLVLTKELIKSADKHAETIACSKKFLKSNGTLGNKKIGESIAMSMKGGLNGSQFTNLLYEENKLHNFKNNSHQKVSENFSQLIWKGTKEVGFGIAKGKKGEYVVVAHYFPAGNDNKEFEKNVSPVTLN